MILRSTFKLHLYTPTQKAVDLDGFYIISP